MHVLVYYKGDIPTVKYPLYDEEILIECPDIETAINIGKTIAYEKGLQLKIAKPH